MRLLDRLRARAEREPHALIFRFLDDEGRVVDQLTVGSLLADADALSGFLVSRCGLAAGDRAILVYPPGLELVRALLGCLRAGVLPVPIYPPVPFDPAPALPGLRHIVDDCGARIALTTRSYSLARQAGRLRGLLGSGSEAWPQLSWFKTDAVRGGSFEPAREPAIGDDDIALLQYTSGSTSAPRGVEITFGGLDHQVDLTHRRGGMSQSSRMVAWLPPYHDFGLITGILNAMSGGGELVLMSPLSFIRRPLLWLEAISTHRASHTAAPNFAYDLVVRKSTPTERAELDLSCLELCMSAAEPILATTVEAFLDAFAVSGLRPEAFWPAYGLAEHTVGVTLRGVGRLRVDRGILESEHRVAALPAPATGEQNEQSVTLVGCGRPEDDIHVRIVDAATRRQLASDLVGEVWVDSPSKARGYWGAPELTEELFHARLLEDDGRSYLRTGDLGFLHEGELYICGRIKDLLILRGRNVYPQDIELTVQNASSVVRPGCVAAIGVPVDGEERLLVIAECSRSPRDAADRAALAAAAEQIALKVMGLHQVRLLEVVWLPPRTIPKTSSGKIQRQRAKTRLADGSLPVVARWQAVVAEVSPSPLQGVERRDDSPAAPAPPGSELSLLEERIWDLLRARPELGLGAAVARETPFRELGLDSVASVETSVHLADLLDRQLPSTLLFEYPTVSSLARHLSGAEQPEPASGSSLASNEPIAIVALACRLPGGVDTPAECWRLFDEGRESIGPFPARWDTPSIYDPDPAAAGKSYVRDGGFIADVDRFDAAFFGIGQREALAMDPQQRLALELAWEALERAAIVPASLRGSATGVYIGAVGSDYGPPLSSLASLDGYRGTGIASSVISGRLAFVFGLQGPVMTVDTACSSSLVALHLACAGLRQGECDLALAGGVQVMASPAPFVEFSRLRGLAPDGRCKSFSASADGVGWSEGCALLVLKRLSEAQADGDPVLAVIRGSAVNHDGQSQGLTVPSGPAQERVIARALMASRVSPRDIDYVEAHGTGTPLGDPIEARALARVYGAVREEGRPLYLGSAKSNLGHSQAAAGVVGLVKVVLGLQAERLPRTLHAAEPTSHFEWRDSGLQLLEEGLEWRRGERVRRAGVSSFGISGTNCHLIVEEAPPAGDDGAAAAPPTAYGPSMPLLLSARDEQGLRRQAGRWAAWLAEHPEVDLLDVLATASRRTHFRGRRAALLVDGTESAIESLSAVAEGRALPKVVVRSDVVETPGLLAWLFGTGVAWSAERWRAMIERHAPFRDALVEVAGLFDAELDHPLLPLLRGEVEDDRDRLLEQPLFAECAAFAFGIGLLRQWRAVGVEPDLLAGCGAGELVAVYGAGAVSLDHAARLALARARLLETSPRGDAMFAIEASEREVLSHLDSTRARVALAGVHGPRHVVVRGEAAATDAMARAFEAQGRRSVRLAVAYVPGPLSELDRSAFTSVARAITFSEPRLGLVSAATGSLVAGDEIGSPDYWQRHLDGTVRFADAITTLHRAGATTFLDCSPDGRLAPLAAMALPADAPAEFVDGSGGEGRAPSLARALATLHVLGHPVEWSPAYRGTGRLVDLPTYAFADERFWLRSQPDVEPADGGEVRHALLERVHRSGSGLVFSGHLSPSRNEFLRRHRLGDLAVASVTTMLEIARGCGATGAEVHDAAILRPLILDEVDGETVQVVLDTAGSSEATFAVYLRDQEGGDQDGDPGPEDKRLMAGRLRRLTPGDPGSRDLAALRGRLGEPGSVAALSAGLARAGIRLSSSRYLAAAWLGENESLLHYDIATDDEPAPSSPHLALLDGAVLALAAAIGGTAAERPRMPSAVARFWCRQACPPSTWFHASRVAGTDSASVVGTVTVLNDSGRILGGIEGLRLEAVDPVRVIEMAHAGDPRRRLVPAVAGAEELVPEGASCLVLTGGAPSLAVGVGRWLRQRRGARRVVWLDPRSASLEQGAGGVEFLPVGPSPGSIADQLGRLWSDEGARGLIHLVDENRSSPANGGFQVNLEQLWAAHQATVTLPLETFVVATVDRAGGLPDDVRSFVDGLLDRRRSRGLAADTISFRRVGAPAVTSSRQQRETGSPPAAGVSTASPLVELRGDALRSLLRQEAARLLGLPSKGDVPLDRPLQELGFDSVMAVELRDSLAKTLGRTVEATVVYDHPTVEALAEYLETGERQRETAGVARSGTDEPIAIVGMACRFPGGADDPASFWRLLIEGVDTVSEVPKDRWDIGQWYDPDPEVMGKMSTREGAFLSQVDRFDAPFFAISRREAEDMDPQQRLLLEVTWEALEDAGTRPADLMESPTGVFVGLLSHDYMSLVGDPERMRGYAISGNTGSIASGRISYFLGTSGPSLTVDTGCSSSLVTVHLACQSLRSGESDLALAGGVSLMLTPGLHVGFSRMGGLASDGRCKTFSAEADGMGWGEGCGMVVLKRLTDARAAGDRILAVVRGSAVNQDGRSNGLTAPNGPAQVSVIRAALDQAGVAPADVGYVEAHGTGTTLGDPIELSSLGAAYGDAREAPLWVGSVKTNIGHAQAAAGIAGLLKVVLALGNGRVPPHLHFATPTPHVDWSRLPLAIPTEATDWPRSGSGRRLAGVSSFSLSGTNAHIIVEEAPEAAERVSPSRRRIDDWGVPLLVSAADPRSLRAQAGRWADWLERHAAVPWPDVVATAALRRSHFQARAAVLASNREQAMLALRHLAEEKPHASLLTGEAAERGRVVFVFPGQGGQWPAMGRRLLEESPVFAEAVTACDEAIAEITGWSVRSVLRGEQDARALPDDRTDVVQPALFAMSIGLAALWRSLGIEPEAVVGVSQGEVAAAVVAGALSLEEGARVVAQRALRLRALGNSGGMVAVQLPADVVLERLEAWGGALSLAVVNSSSSSAVAGDRAALEQLLASLEAEGVFCRWIGIDYASHSPQVDAILPAIAEDLATIRPRPARLPFYSTVGDGILAGVDLDAAYWCRNLRQPVRLDRALDRLQRDGYGVFVELSPHPVLSLPLSGAAATAGGVVVGSLRRGEGSLQDLFETLGRLHVEGCEVDWRRHLDVHEARLVDLPTYAFERQRYWPEASPQASGLESAGLSSADHPLLGAVTPLADSHGLLATARLSLGRTPWLADHAIFGTVLFPAAGFLELAVAVARELEARVASLTLTSPLALPEREAVRVQVVVEAQDAAGRRAITVHSRPEDAASAVPWVRHAEGWLEQDSPSPPLPELTAWPPEGAEPVDIASLYERFAALGAAYGPAFRGLVEAWRSPGALFGRVVCPDSIAAEGYCLHPALLDAAVHTMALAEPAGGDLSEGVFLPVEWADVTLLAGGASEIRVQVDFELSADGRQAVGCVLLADGTGRALGRIGSVSLRRATAEEVRGALRFGLRHLYRVDWRPVAIPMRSNRALDREWVVGIGGVSDLLGREPLPVLELLGADSTEELPERIWLDATGPDPLGRPLERQPDPGDDVVRLAHDTTRFALDSVSRWLSDERWSGSDLVCVTRCAVGTGPPDAVEGLAQAPLWGLLRTARNENPGRSIRLVDLGHEATTAGQLRRLAAVENESEVVYRRATVLVPRLVPATDELETAGADLSRGGEATVLVTGGTGDLGLVLARHLVERHRVRHLVLTSRRGLEALRARDQVEELLALGAATVVVEACDATDREALAGVLARIPAQRPLSGVFHLAGILDDGVLTGLDHGQLLRVLAPKLDGAWNLHRLTLDCDLSCFVLFGSVASTLGTLGQANYAAANAFLDALAHHRRHRGLPASCLAWGFWAGARTGMTSELAAADLARLERQGMIPMEPEVALRLLDDTLERASGNRVPVVMDLARVERMVAAGMPVPSVLRGLVRPRLRKVTASMEDPSSLRARLAAMSAEDRRRAIEEIVRREVAVVLGLGSSDAIEVDQPLRDLGFDSLMAVELRNRLSALAGMTLPAMLALNYPSVGALSEKLTEDYFSSGLEETRGRKALRSIDVDQALFHLREAGLVQSLKNAGLLEPVVEVLGELSLEGHHGGTEAISRNRALDISRNMDEESVDAKLDSILDN